MAPRTRARAAANTNLARPGQSSRSSTDSAKPSYWEIKLDITPRKEDRMQWNQDWEKRGKTVKPNKLFDWLSRQLSERVPGNRTLPQLRELIIGQQGHVDLIVGDLFDGRSVTGTWLLLPEYERRKHVEAGLDAACDGSPLGVDARVLCPEISAKAMLKSGGQPYLDFMKGFIELKKSFGPGQLIILQSPTWDDVAESQPQPLSDRDKLVLALGSLHRSYFILTFILESARSIMRDMTEGNDAISSIQQLAAKDRSMAALMAHSVNLITSEQSVRCEHCKKKPGDAGAEGKFSVCGTCKNKIATSVHYCSRQCQKADWPKHKFTCGIKPPASKRINMELAEKSGMGNIADYIEDMSLLRTAGEFEVRSEFYNPPLALQIEMLEECEYADYFLRDRAGKYHPFIAEEGAAQKFFRICRRGALTGLLPDGVFCMGQYMLDIIEKNNPFGLDRRSVLNQLKEEWGDDYEVRLARFDRSVQLQHGRGATMLGAMASGMNLMMPNIVSTFLARRKR